MVTEAAGGRGIAQIEGTQQAFVEQQHNRHQCFSTRQDCERLHGSATCMGQLTAARKRLGSHSVGLHTRAPPRLMPPAGLGNCVSALRCQPCALIARSYLVCVKALTALYFGADTPGTPQSPGLPQVLMHRRSRARHIPLRKGGIRSSALRLDSGRLQAAAALQ